MKTSFNGRIKCPGLGSDNHKILKKNGLINWHGNYGPNWYEQLSDRQMRVADNLNRSVIEDYENGTVNRCKQCLIGIGIKPIVNNENIGLALSLSKGNDITFLWFLMKIFYPNDSKIDDNNDNNNNFQTICSFNERLFMSTLCHLDMVMTLRKLDEILPPNQPNKPVKPVTNRKPKPKRIIYNSPYLEPLPKPKILKSKALSRPIFPGPNFLPYNCYENPNFIIENEKSRWFSIKNTKKSSKDEMLENLFSIEKRDVNKLFNQFTNAVQCNCRKNCHKPPEQETIVKNKVIVVFKNELDNAISPKEFNSLIIVYQCQKMVQECFSTLLFNESKIIFQNIRICNNCSECKRDLDLLYKLRINSKKSNDVVDQYDKYINPFIFGSNTTNAEKLLIEFNKLAANKPIDVCVKNVWQFELKLWTDKRINFEELYIDWNISSKINPYNKKQMNSLLKIALHEISKDPKYILPSLPNAHLLPILIEWIRVKYGYRTTEKLRNVAMHKSVKQWRQLIEKCIINPIAPTAKKICPRNLNVTFNDKFKVSDCINKLKNEYFHRLNLAWLKETGEFWPTMKSFMCSTNCAAMRQLFYAYMPSNEYDILPFRPWKDSEYNDNVFHRSS